MGLFTKRRRVPAAPLWEFLAGPRTIPAAQVEDDGCAAPTAHEVAFWCPGSPPRILVAFYASYGPPEDGGFLVGYRYQLRDAGHCGASWFHTGWGCLGSLSGDGQPYRSMEAADAAARRRAAGYAAGVVAFPDEDLGGDVFTWDGVPW